MTVAERIQQTYGCNFIPLSNLEYEIYEHAGYRLACFKDGNLVDFFDFHEFPDSAEALSRAIGWLIHNPGETWLVLCSAGNLLEPQRLIIDDHASLIHLQQVIHKDFAGHGH